MRTLSLCNGSSRRRLLQFQRSAPGRPIRLHPAASHLPAALWKDVHRFFPIMAFPIWHHFTQVPVKSQPKKEKTPSRRHFGPKKHPAGREPSVLRPQDADFSFGPAGRRIAALILRICVSFPPDHSPAGIAKAAKKTAGRSTGCIHFQRRQNSYPARPSRRNRRGPAAGSGPCC